MQRLLFAVLFSVSLSSAASVYDYTLNSIDGSSTPISSYKGKVLLLVNVASKCGFTPQYKQLEAVYEKYKDQGLVILGFPANNFGGQEPGTNAEIKDFCSRTYDVKFPMYGKISVKGDDKAPLYQFLTDKDQNPDTGGEIKWNFTKFLVDRHGKIVARYESSVTPDSTPVIATIEKALKESAK